MTLLWTTWGGYTINEFLDHFPSVKREQPIAALEILREVLLTYDRNIQHQQNVSALGLALVVLAVPDKKLDTIHPLVPEILAVLDTNPQPGTLSIVGSWRV